MIWEKDILGGKFRRQIITLRNDYEGKCIATLVHLLPSNSHSEKAILYIHGFNDYFFQEEMATNLFDAGYNFYALDLRKYGRSYLPHQKFNDVRDLKSYYKEINKAIDIIRRENRTVILMGHSTGGLIVTLYAKDNTGSKKFDGLILNSPFFDFNLKPKLLKKFIPLISAIGKNFPSLTISNVLDKRYGESLHKDYSGSWNYSLQWKPNTPPPVSLGWIRAIYRGQAKLRKKVNIKEPILVMHSDKSIENKNNDEEYYNTDAVLSIEDINKIAKNIEGNTLITPIEGGIHDLVLSEYDVKKKVYQTIIDWLHQYT